MSVISRTRLPALLTILLVCLPLTATPQSARLQLLDNNISGGGFQSDVSISVDGQTVYSSADVSGVFKSIDGGLRFEKRNRGLRSLKIASLAMTADNPQIIYVGSGDKGGSGGLFRSTDGGGTWELTDAGNEAQFAGNHTALADPLPRGHPRSNGDLIVIDEGEQASDHADDIVIAGTYKTGVMVFEHGGDKLAANVNASGFVRSVARQPTVSGIAYAAIQFADRSRNGIYEIDYRNSQNTVSTLVYRCATPEGLAVLSNGHVYGATGSDGIVKFDGTAWSNVSSGLALNDERRQWTAVAGYVIKDRDIVYAGTTNMGGSKKGKKYSTIWRTRDGGLSWSPLVDVDTNVSDNIYGKPYAWWFRTRAFSNAGLGRSNSVVSSIAVSPGRRTDDVADDIVYVSGRGGLWKSDNGGTSWNPAVFNMQATSNNAVAVNPQNPDHIAVANTDYTVLATTTAFAGSSMARVKPKGAASKGYDLLFDSKTTELIVGVGSRDAKDPGNGEVYVQSALKTGALSGNDWKSTGLAAATSPANGRVRAVSVGYHNGSASSSRIILAAVEGEGVYRHVQGKWIRSTGVDIGATEGSRFAWPDNARSGVVYLLDLSAGLFRSSDGGENWMNIWPAMQFRNTDFYNTGYIAADDRDPGTVYLSIQGDGGAPVAKGFHVYRLTDADTRTFGPQKKGPGITDIGKHSGAAKIKRPGPLVIGPSGHLWLTEQQDARKGIQAALYVMENPSTNSKFEKVSNKDYEYSVITPTGIAVASSGHLYITQNGNGLAKLALPCDYRSDC